MTDTYISSIPLTKESELPLSADAPSPILGVSLREFDMFEQVKGRSPKSLDELVRFKADQVKKIS